MSEIKQIIAQICGPSAGNPGKVTYGFNVVDGGVPTMTDENGVPVRDKGGDIVRHSLRTARTSRSWRGC